MIAKNEWRKTGKRRRKNQGRKEKATNKENQKYVNI
jgi:hypothetical protein